jgi:hypothetical protein
MKGRLGKQRECGLADADTESERSLDKNANKKSLVLPNRTGIKRLL